MIWDSHYRHGRHKHFGRALAELVGHLLATSALFVTILLLSWGLAFLFSWLHAVHPFPAAIHGFLEKVELVLVYADAILCAVVLLYGTARFIKELLGVRS